METKIIYGRWDEHCRSVEIHTEWDGMIKRFATVSQSTSISDFKPEKATVNWSAMGSVPPSVALAAAHALMAAAKIAVEMEHVEEWGRITPPAEGMTWEGPGMPEIHIEYGKAWVDSDGWVKKEGAK